MATDAVTFISKCRNQLIWLGAPERPEYDALNRRVGAPGREIQFEDSTYTTDEPEVIEGVRASDLFNLTIWEEGAAPDEPKPTTKVQLKAIAIGAAKGDRAAIKAVLKEEQATHKRDVVKDAGEAALEALPEADEAKQEKASSTSRPSKTS